MKNRIIQGSFRIRLVVAFIILLFLSTVIVGMTGFLTAKNALDMRGKQILQNGVMQSIDMIQSYYEQVQNGYLTKEDAQEQVKIALMGEKNPDGTRSTVNEIDLGENGYFIIYDSLGNEIMHPNLEGQNVYHVIDMKDGTRFIVQEQIEFAKNDGGFLIYNWNLPNSSKIEEKISYGEYFPEWDWIVVATAYTKEFNKDASSILISTITVTLALAIILTIMINHFVSMITDPIRKVLDGMSNLELGNYKTIEQIKSDSETARLVNGYNNMIQYLKDADENIRFKSDQLSFIAYHDVMTELPNFFGMEHYVTKRVKSKPDQAVFILMNLMGLNVINGIMGYDKGNRLIKEVGNYLNSRSASFYTARTSSNEFGIWIEKNQDDDLENWILELKQSLLKHTAKLGFGQTIDFCFAVTLYPEHGTEFDMLYENATLVMKLIKDKSEDSVGFYKDSMKILLQKRIDVFAELSDAFLKEEIIPYYQKQVDYVTKKVVGVEALARWHSERFGIVPPKDFLPVIAERNLLPTLAAYMLRSALRDYGRLCDEYGPDITVSVNISPTAFLSSGIADMISSELKLSGVPAEKLIIEITEDVFITNLDEVAKITKSLHHLGVKISIDDFGSGYSSLNYLSQVDFDELKIDKSFIDRILNDERAFEMVRIFCNIASVYNYKIIAEGIESGEQLEKIKETDVTIIQGYLFSRPEPIKTRDDD
ncbi:MAG: EAL domain-containing protein [Lachnospiraceae bacterium]